MLTLILPKLGFHANVDLRKSGNKFANQVREFKTQGPVIRFYSLQMDIVNEKTRVLRYQTPDRRAEYMAFFDRVNILLLESMTMFDRLRVDRIQPRRKLVYGCTCLFRFLIESD